MQNCHVLIVDDMMHLREALAFFFKKKGFSVFEAGNGVIAMEILKSTKIDLIVSDIRMPESDGLALLKHIRSNESLQSMPFIFVSAFADLSNDKAYQQGANAIFPKPFDPEDILNCATQLLKPKALRWSEEPTVGHPDGYKKVVLKAQELIFNQPGKHLNFGSSGFFVACNEQQPEVDDLISFDIEFSDGDLNGLKCLGQVVWNRQSKDGSKPPGYGVQIIAIDQKMKEHFIAKLEHSKVLTTIPAH